MRLVINLLLLVFLVNYSFEQEGQTSRCLNSNARNCKQCLEAGPECAWCARDDFTGARCQEETALEKTCNPEIVLSEIRESGINKPLSSDVTDPVQLYPQNIEVNLRPKQKMSKQITFKFAANYPVDLYFLMDFSNSMCELKDVVTQQALKIAARMRNITENFQLGFGGFVDKQTTPFIDQNPAALVWPCPVSLSDEKLKKCGCQAAFGFKNFVPLTEDSEQFRTKVSQANISANLDAPEGGLDALVQVILCQKQIGWRKVSRRMIVYASDAAMHMAGDGRIAGLITPFEPKCFLATDVDGIDTLPIDNQLQYDYPSFSQIQDLAKDNRVNFIFIANEDVQKYYETIASFFDGAAVGLIRKPSAAGDDTDIVKLIEDNYRKIANEIKFELETPMDGLNVEVQAKCVGEKKFTKKSKCDKVNVGDEVTFQLDFYLTKCPDTDKLDYQLKFGLQGLQDKLNVKLKTLCKCPCEDAPMTPVVPACDNHGRLRCGVCACSAGWTGSYCNCTAGQTTVDESQCIREGQVGVVCSGRGYCDCGECKCQTGFTGKYCECNQANCPRGRRGTGAGLVCSGRGECPCETCECHAGYKYDRCQCPIATDRCYNPDFPDKVCSGNGECECNRCRCKGEFRGRYCSDCPTCPGFCAQQKPCVLCRAFQQYASNAQPQTAASTAEGSDGPPQPPSEGGGVSDQVPLIADAAACEAQCQHVRVVDEFTKAENIKSLLRECQDKDEDGCIYMYQYWYDGARGPRDKRGDLVVEIRRSKDCPTYISPWIIGLIIVGVIVLIGLIALIIFFCLKRYWERKEIERMGQEAAKGLVQTNPEYVPPSQTWQAQTYKDGSYR